MAIWACLQRHATNRAVDMSRETGISSALGLARARPESAPAGAVCYNASMTASPLALIVCLCAATLAACAPESQDTAGDSETSTEPATTEPAPTDGTTTEPTTTDGTTTEPADPACACIDPDNFSDESYVCDLGPCPLVVAFCDVNVGPLDEEEPGCEGVGGVFSVDEAALECALLQLKDGDEGAIAFAVDSNDPGSQGGFVQLLPDRQALMRTYQWYDLGGAETPAGVVSLKDAAYFEACIDEADPATRFKCFRAWSAQEPAAQCDESGAQSDD